MSSYVIRILAPQRIATPRGAGWAAEAVAWIAGAGPTPAVRGASTKTREEKGPTLFARALRSAERWLCQAEREPRGAREVLEYACRIERTMPSLASDLRAAAMRHQESED